MKTKNISFFLLVIATLFLVGCKKEIKYIASPPEIITPPKVMMENCSRTPINPATLRTNSDLAKAYKTREYDMDKCDNQLEELRGWFDQMEEEGATLNKK